MGVCVHYWPIPPQSRLSKRLREDRVDYALMANLFSEGGGIYRFSEFQEEDDFGDVEETFEFLIEDLGAMLGPDPQARINVFLEEVERTRAEFPGIEDRTAMIEKASSEIERALIRVLSKTRPDAEIVVSKMMFGDQELAPDLSPPGEALGLISVEMVREAASILEPLTGEDLFPSAEGLGEWYRDNFEEWRGALMDAAEHREEMLVGVS